MHNFSDRALRLIIPNRHATDTALQIQYNYPLAYASQNQARACLFNRDHITSFVRLIFRVCNLRLSGRKMQRGGYDDCLSFDSTFIDPSQACVDVLAGSTFFDYRDCFPDKSISCSPIRKAWLTPVFTINRIPTNLYKQRCN